MKCAAPVAAGLPGKRPGKSAAPLAAKRLQAWGRRVRGGAPMHRRPPGPAPKEMDVSARIRLPLALLVLVLLACPVAATAEAQTDAPAPAAEEAAEDAQSGTEQEEEGFWGGIVSSIVDFFGGDSEKAGADEDPGENPDETAQDESATEDDADPTRDAGPEEAPEPEAAAVTTDIVSSEPNRRRTPGRAQADGDDITPSHVYRATADLVSEIAVLREAMKVDDSPDGVRLREQAAPIHIHAKTLEVLEKTARVQKRLGMIPADIGHMPVDPVSQGDLHRGVLAVIEELRRIKRQMVVDREIEPAPLAGGKSSSLVYWNLARASLLLDGLVGRPTSPNDLYRHMLRVHDEMLLVADALDVSLDLDPPAVDGPKEPVAVAQEVVRAANKVVSLQAELGMDASRPPDFALRNATAADVLDAANYLLAEVARIKAHLGVRLPGGGSPEARDRTTADVFARVLLIVRNLDIMSRAAEGAG